MKENKLKKLQYFESNKGLTSEFIQKLRKDKIDEVQKFDITKDLLSKFNNSLDINDLDFKSLLTSKELQLSLEYFNNYRKESGGKDSENLSLGILCSYLIERLEVTLNKDFKNKEINALALESFRDLLNSFRIIVRSLKVSSNDYVRFLQRKYSPGKKLSRSQSDINYIKQQCISLMPKQVVKLLKEMLNHLILCLAKGETLEFQAPFTSSELFDENFSFYISKISKKSQELLDFEDLKEIFSIEFNSLIDSYLSLIPICIKGDPALRFNIIPKLVSLLYINRGVITNLKYTKDTISELCDSITAEGIEDLEEREISEALPDLEEICKELFSHLRDTEIPEIEETPLEESQYLYASGKSGPNGQSSLLNIPFDAKALLQDRNLLESIIQLGSKLGIIIEEDMLNKISKLPVPNIKVSEETRIKEGDHRILKKEPTHSKLIFFKDKGDKDRVVAEVDLFTQTVLKPIHILLVNISKSLGELSAQYNQDLSFEVSASESIQTGFIGTLDLRNATDFLYIKIQSKIVEKLCKLAFKEEGIGILWSKVISLDRKFTINSFEDTLDPISYKIGQPMGALSSWMLLHITIICIIKQGIINCKRKHVILSPSHNHYSVCGDDLTISNPFLFKEVKTIMNKLRLQINESKSFECDQSHINSIEDRRLFGEYLKKFVLDKNIFRPLSPGKCSKFVVYPGSYGPTFIFDLLIIGVDINLQDLLNYSIFKRVDSISSSKSEEDINPKDIRKRYQEFLDQIFFYILGDHRVGGCNSPILEVCKEGFLENNMYFTSLLLKYNIFDINNILYSKLLSNKINRLISSSIYRADQALLSIFSKRTLSILKEKGSPPNKDDLDPIESLPDIKKKIEVEESNLGYSFYSHKLLERYFDDHIIFTQFIRLIILKRVDSYNNILKYRETLEHIEQKRIRKNITNSDIKTLEELHKVSKKTLVSIDAESLLGLVIHIDTDKPSIISRSFMNFIQSETLYEVSDLVKIVNLDLKF